MKKLISLIIVLFIFSGALSVCSVSAYSELKFGTSFKLANTENGVKISWKKGYHADTYYLYRKTASDKKFKKIKEFKKAGSYTDKSVKAGRKYTYKMATLNGCIYTDTLPTSIVRLKAPTSIKGKLIHMYDVYKYDSFETIEEEAIFRLDLLTKLSWKKVKGAKEYEIYQAAVKNDKAGKYKKIKTVKSTLCYCGYDEVKEGVYYKYKIKAVRGSSKSVFSAATKKLGYLRAPFAYNSVNKYYNKDGKGHVVVYWEKSKNADGYLIYRSDDGGKTYRLIEDYKGISDNYTDTSATDGKVYYYYVLAYKGEMTSRLSDANTIRDLSKNYDVSVKAGETVSDFPFSVLYTEFMNKGASSVIVSSDNESVVTVKTEKSESGFYNVKLSAVKEGYAEITLKAELDGKATTNVIRVFVHKDKCCNVILRENEMCRLINLDTRIASVYSDIKAEYKVTSDNEAVARIDSGDYKGFLIKALSEGEAVVNLKISVDGQEVYNKDYLISVDNG